MKSYADEHQVIVRLEELRLQIRIPKSREAWSLWVADKIETFREMRVKP